MSITCLYIRMFSQNIISNHQCLMQCITCLNLFYLGPEKPLKALAFRSCVHREFSRYGMPSISLRAGSRWSTSARGVAASAKSRGEGARRENGSLSWRPFTRLFLCSSPLARVTQSEPARRLTIDLHLVIKTAQN